MNLPGSAPKKIRFYLKQVSNRLGSLPALPPPDPGLQATCQEILKPDWDAFNTLLPRFESTSTKGLLIYGPLLKAIGSKSARPTSRPIRGCTEGCYRTEMILASQCTDLLLHPRRALQSDGSESGPDRNRLEEHLSRLLPRSH